MEPRLTQITPFVPCSSLPAQISFYRDILGFTVGYEAENYAFLRCDSVAIRLVEVDAAIDLHSPEREGSFYIDVAGLDAMYERLRPKLDTLPSARVRAPFDQEYDQREFHVADEDCTLVFFGEAVTR